MSLDVQCPKCQSILRPGKALMEQGGSCPCPTCSTLLSIDPETFRETPTVTAPLSRPPADRSRSRPSRPPRSRPGNRRRVPVWVWPVAGFVVVFLLAGSAIGAYALLKPGGRTFWGAPSLTETDFRAKMQNNLTPAQVRSMLGKPTEESDSEQSKAAFQAAFGKTNMFDNLPSMRQMVWTDHKTYTAVVIFVDEKVAMFDWLNGPLSDYKNGGGFGPGWGGGGGSNHDAFRRQLEDERRRARERDHFRRR